MLSLYFFAAVLLGGPAVVLCLALAAGLTEEFFLFFNSKWYGAVVQSLSTKSRVLDVGSGLSCIRTLRERMGGMTFGTLIGTVKILLAMEVKVVGIEPDGEKFKNAGINMARAGLKHSIVLHNKSIYDKSLQQVFTGAQRFDAVCFSSPLMSFSDPVAALRMAASLLKESGKVYIPHVLINPSSSVLFKILTPIFKLLHIVPIEEVKRVALETDLEVIDDIPAFGTDGKKPQPARILVLQAPLLGACTTSQPKQNASSDVRPRKNVDSEK